MNARNWNRLFVLAFFSLISFILSPAASAAVVTGLSAHWAYDDGSGSIITDDVAPAANNATINASPNWVTGVVGGAHRFSGSNYATSSASPIAPNINVPLTLATWVRPENYSSYQSNGIAQYGGLINKWSGNFAWALENMKNSYYDGAWKANPAIVAQDQWSHVAVVVTGGVASYYHNGIKVGTAAASIYGTTTTPVYTLGAILAGSYRLQGAMDDSGVWTSAKADAEIAAIHGLGRYSGVALDDAVIDQLLALNTVGANISGVGPGNDNWFYTNDFAAGNPQPLQVGLAYTATNGYNYIVLQNLSGQFFGLTTSTPPPAPEPSTSALMFAGLVGMSRLRRRQRSQCEPTLTI